jgi:2-oxoglutarate ferredoxin oxidoreductase subunit alpha
MSESISLVLGGAAGQGIQTVETLLVALLKKAGYHVFACKEYMSMVRGGVNSTEIRIGTQPVQAFTHRIDVLFALEKDAIQHLNHRISAETFILTEDIKACGDNACPDNLITLPFADIAKKIGNVIYSNIVAVGMLAALFGIPDAAAIEMIKSRFGDKGDKMLTENVTAYQKGVELVKGLPETLVAKLHSLQKSTDAAANMMINGAEAVAFGAIAGGCNFLSAYPMSPHTNVMVQIAQHGDEFGVILDQAEDEIAAVNKGVAAWYAGARALISTAGGGYDLMTEGLSMAAVMESPLVVHIAQRPGPGTGLPTRTAQEDLNLALYAGHGEFPRIILSPGSIADGFYLTQQAFNLADRFQVPVFILTDQYYVDTYYDLPVLDPEKFPVERHIIKTNLKYNRYTYTDTGISPRGVPMYGDGLVRADTDEHDEYGLITEDLLITRPKMVEKRLFKRMTLLKNATIQAIPIGTQGASTLIVTWGSNYHALTEAIEQVGRSDLSGLFCPQLYPVPPDVRSAVIKAKRVIVLECNATGQFAQLLQNECGRPIPESDRWIRYDGVPNAVEDLVTRLKSL